MQSHIFVESYDVNKRLADLGLDAILLTDAARRGFAAWASCTPSHPALMPGIVGWGETVAALREELSKRGWQRSDEGNLPLVINRSGTMAISVATGNEATGSALEMPSTKASKGPKTANAVVVNQHQMQLFPELLPLPENLISQRNRTLWFLLIHRDSIQREVRCELSRPINMSADGHVDGWVERIILGSFPFGADNLVLPSDSGPQAAEIVVEIKKRG